LPKSSVAAAVFGCGIFCLSLALSDRASAQDSTVVRLPPVRVEASRGSLTSDQAAAAISILTRTDTQRRTEPALSLESILTEMPGVWVADRTHLALGERLIVRGLGSRAAFGVRSVAVLLDGVLLTMPDGQAVLDPVEPAVVSRVELIRGPASRFWGNAAGGVMSIQSGALPTDGIKYRVRALGGAFGTKQALAEVSMAGRRHQSTGYLSYLDRVGYRSYASGRIARAGLRSRIPLSSGAVLSLTFNMSDLNTDSPGSLTRDQWDEDPSDADSRYIDTDSGKRATQTQASIGLTSSFAGGLLSTSLFGVKRSLDNPLPFAWIGVERIATGGRLDWRYGSEEFSLGLAADWRLQVDDRINTENAGGERGQNLRLDQKESIGGLGGSLVGEYRLNRSFAVSGGVRIDRLSVDMDDHLLSNGDQSGRESFVATSPSAGVTFTAGRTLLFASFSTAFEIPTTTELVNRPDGLGGFNPGLDPQRISGIELGLRHGGSRGRLDLAAYRQQLTNFLSPFQQENGDGRTFYRNVGMVDYSGIEVAWTWLLNASLSLDGTASFHRYEFASGDREGRTEPGVPERFGSVRLTAARGHIAASTRVRAAGKQFADDANASTVAGFVVVDVRLAGKDLTSRRLSAAPFLELTNVLDETFVASIVVNARGGRYYEGTPGRALTIGLDLRF